MKGFYPLLLVALIYACTPSKEQTENTDTIKVVEAQGFQLPNDSLRPPTVVLVDKNKLTKVRAGKPKTTPLKTNVRPAGKPTVRRAGKPRTCTPGKDSIKLPITFPASGKEVMAGIPQVVIAKEPFVRDLNPQNFSIYGKRQGLINNSIQYMLQDKNANIWLGTNGGIVCYDGKNFTTYGTKEGLCSNRVRCMLQDRSGALWIGTFNGGLCCFNGKTFKTFTTKEGLPDNYVRSMLQDRHGYLWFGTNKGLIRYDGTSFSVFTEQQGLANNCVYSILEDKSGKLWFGTNNGVSCYNGNSFATFTIKEGLCDNVILSIFEDTPGSLWFGTEDGLCCYDGSTFATITQKQGLCNNLVWSISQDQKGSLWFATYNGLCSYDGKTFTTYTDKEGLTDNVVLNTLHDNSGNIWLGTLTGGLSLYNGKTFTFFSELGLLKDYNVLSLYQDKTGNIWFGSYDGVTYYDGKSFHYFTTKEGLCSNAVFSIHEDRSGNLWFGTDLGISCYDGETFTSYLTVQNLNLSKVSSITQDKSGNLWIGTIDQGAFCYDGKFITNYTTRQGLCSNVVWKITEDHSGNLWFGTNNGVSSFNGKTFTNYAKQQGLCGDFIQNLMCDKSGNLWFGAEDGLSFYNGKQFITLTEKQGLSNNKVATFLEDSSGTIWFGAAFGISKLKRTTWNEVVTHLQTNTPYNNENIFESYGYDDGFLGIGCSRASLFNKNDETIWIGTNTKLTVYHPPVMDKADTIPPNIQLNGLQLFNEPLPWTDLLNNQDTNLKLGNGVILHNCTFSSLSKWYAVPENLSLAYNNNYLNFSFIGITMKKPNQVKYQYMLQGFDEHWSARTNRTNAPYGNLPPGTYTFCVKAVNSTGYWSPPLQYTFSIRPPWWLTWWFKTLVVVFATGLIWRYIRWRERKLKKEKEMLESAVALRTKEVVNEKKQVEEQKKRVEEKNVMVLAQKRLIEEKHKEITDSINYAERIQRSFIASKKMLDENLTDYFVLFIPKAVVSGDFYWAAKLNNGNFALVTADSTGHGVPGAIMSLLNITSLEKAVEICTQPADILTFTRKTIIERLKNDGSADGGKDGMDCSLLSFDFKHLRLSVAAANNPVWILRGNEVIEIEPDKMPVGKHDQQNLAFTQKEITLQSGDLIYTFTDGYADQFGGTKGKKFLSKNLRLLLASNMHLNPAQQKSILLNTLNTWKGDNEQVDDITVIGVKI